MKRIVVLIAALAGLSACAVDPQAAAVRRAALIQQVFPEAYEQRGLDLVFPLKSGGTYGTSMIGYSPAEVTQDELTRRVASCCARQNSAAYTGGVVISKDLGLSTRALPEGGSKQVRILVYKCATNR